MDPVITSAITTQRRAEGVPSPRRFKPYPAYKDSGVEWLEKKWGQKEMGSNLLLTHP